MNVSNVPLYNLRAVLRETGLSADTLRAWERRYGLPAPRRSKGGHRLYSDKDIFVLKWLKARQTEGLTISRAVERWRQLVAAGADPWQGEAPGGYAATSSGSSVSVGLERVRSEWLAACMAYNETLADQILDAAFGLHTVETVVLEVLLPALHAIGEEWQQGRTSVQQEHFASALVARRLDAITAALPVPSGAHTLLLTCPETELHALPLQFLAVLLKRRGHKVVNLGADVPTAELAATIGAVRPTLVLMAAQGLRAAVGLQAAATVVADQGIGLAFGGRIFNHLPELTTKIAGQYLGQVLQEVPDQIEGLLARRPVIRRRERPRPGSEARRFADAQAQIDVHVQRSFARTPLPTRHLMTANSLLGNSIAAALAFGDIAYAGADMPSNVVALQQQGMPTGRIDEHLLAYSHGVRRVLGSDGAVIVAWLESKVKASKLGPQKGRRA
ncbi:MAG TPA: MerR family transcriptional regulator [Anaerolineales bacterium]|nr:MerR family transcriptional regulator [Anaerolineales bacterium]